MNPYRRRMVTEEARSSRYPPLSAVTSLVSCSKPVQYPQGAQCVPPAPPVLDRAPLGLQLVGMYILQCPAPIRTALGRHDVERLDRPHVRCVPSTAQVLKAAQHIVVIA